MPNNYYRMLRVLEILLATGRPRSDFNLNTGTPLDFDIRCFFLDRPRISLYRRIDLRCEQMLQGGMLQVRTRVAAELAAVQRVGLLAAKAALHQCVKCEQTPIAPYPCRRNARTC